MASLTRAECKGYVAAAFVCAITMAGIAGYSCFPSTTSPVNTSFVGDNFGGYFDPVPKEAFGYNGTLSPDGKTLAFSYGFGGPTGNCSGDYGRGTLTLQ